MNILPDQTLTSYQWSANTLSSSDDFSINRKIMKIPKRFYFLFYKVTFYKALYSKNIKASAVFFSCFYYWLYSIFFSRLLICGLSYTNLIYKKFRFWCSSSCLKNSFPWYSWFRSVPVSYTHLDVYKRQVIFFLLHIFLHLFVTYWNKE